MPDAFRETPFLKIVLVDKKKVLDLRQLLFTRSCHISWQAFICNTVFLPTRPIKFSIIPQGSACKRG